jgi:virulence factor Mce-like protein
MSSDPDQTPNASGTAEASYRRAAELIRRGEPAEAEPDLRAADEAGHPTAPALLGLIAEASGDLDGARAAYARADQRGDRLGGIRLGLLASRAGDWSEAQSIWARAEQRPAPAGIGELEAALLARPASGTAVAAAEPIKSSAFTNPVLIGAIAVLVVLVCVFLAYNANAGLPFVPSRELRVDVADGSDLVSGNDVLESGTRIGFVQSMKPIVLPNGEPAAQLILRLSTTKGRLPVDSTATILSRSVLGLKYVQITVGHSRQVFRDGGTMPITQTHVPVRLDQLFGTFNARTRSAIQRDLRGYGDTFAGRGSALNDTVAALPSLLGHLRPVAQYLAAPSTELTRFLRSLNAFTSTVAPVAEVNVRLLADAATTFQAISKSPSDLETTIKQSPGTLEVSTRSLKVQQPFLVNLATLGTNLTPATQQLRAALPSLNSAVEAGTRTLIRTPSLDAHLQQVMNALKRLAQNPSTGVALNGLTATVDVLNPTLRYLGPYVTVCNYWNYWWTNLAGDADEETAFGYAQRVLLNLGNPLQANNVGSQGATAPANGGFPDSPLGAAEYLHAPNYGAAVDSHGNADCEVGQRGYPQMLNHLDPLHRKLDTDSHTPGDQGTTWTGLHHVPKGETFTRVPQLGPAPPFVASNP